MNKTLVNIKDLRELSKERKIDVNELINILEYAYKTESKTGLVYITRSQIKELIDKYRTYPPAIV